MSRTLVAGQDFDSSWITELVFEPQEDGSWGILRINMKSGGHKYAVTRDIWSRLQNRARATLHGFDSTGKAYNEEVKEYEQEGDELSLAEVQSVVSLGRLEQNE